MWERFQSLTPKGECDGGHCGRNFQLPRWLDIPLRSLKYLLLRFFVWAVANMSVCPSALPVDKLITIRSAECTGCLECVAGCPSEGALHLALSRWTRSPNDGRLPSWAIAVGIALLFFGIIGYAKTTGHWTGEVPDYTYRQLVPRANDVNHPAE